MEIVSVSVHVDLQAECIEDCTGDGTDHWFWTAPEFEYEDSGCFNSREEALIQGQRSIMYQLKDLFDGWRDG